ncbi:His-Xaa-Ser system radical SAM maturase HxsC [Desulfurella sp.]|uniref:His-Xaa-Ser system radical SAM maturase HxsC n=1 Tax=Desulfurella sp. TaxID=1962857 RepID=UPI0025BC57EC|nr:His-Xaa-Ser system radical SAM maturase HxsC [Desulfurella sp.]
MKSYKGTPYNINNTIIGKVTHKNNFFLKRKNYVILCNEKCSHLYGYSGAIFISPPALNIPKKIPYIYYNDNRMLSDLKDDDVVLLNPDGSINVLWETESNDNVFFLTNQCNCKCIQCPQPPHEDPQGLFELNLKILNLIDPQKTNNLCITGGEPTILGDRFIGFLKKCADTFPESNITILTNGTQFSNFEFTKQVCSIKAKNLLICISLYADTYILHDRITRLKGSFYNTVKGIQNIAKFYKNIEIRFVISKLNYQRLLSFAIFVYRNFPFVTHVAFMGLEMTGYAEKNLNEVWIDPVDYKDYLKSAVLELERRDINVSIYNIPLCLLPKDIWRFSRKSISNWKNDYLPICKNCDMQEMCCGIFTTSAFQSNNIKPIVIDKNQT